MVRRAALRVGLASSLVVALAVNAAAGVLVVNRSGGGDFTQIQPAVDAAAEGDTILVKAGSYGRFTIDGKALTVVAEAGAVVQVGGGISIVDLAATQTVVLGGLWSTGLDLEHNPSEESAAGVYIVGNAGPVRLQSCTFHGGAGDYDNYCGCGEGVPCPGGPGAIVRQNTAGVAFDRCTLGGGYSHGELECGCGMPTNAVGGIGVDVRDGLVALYDCTVFGNEGGDSCEIAGHGGSATRLSTTGALTGAVTSGTTMHGGTGGAVVENGGATPGNGGPALEVGAGTQAWLLGDVLTGGAGGRGCPISSCEHDGAPGPTVAGGGDTFTFSVPKLTLQMATTVREGTTIPVTVTGRPGDEVYLWSAEDTGFRALPSWKGALLMQRSPQTGGMPRASPVRILGTIPGSGVLVETIRIPELAPTQLEKNVFFQVWRNSPIDGRTVGGFAAVTVLDSIF